MTTLVRTLPIILVLASLSPTTAWSQQLRAAPASAPSQCTNNLKQIGIALHNQASRSPSLAAGEHRIAVCAEAGRVYLGFGDGLVGARLRGCPADVADRGFGEATVRTVERPNGLSVVLLSGDHRGCSATALLEPIALDPRIVPADLTYVELRDDREVARFTPRTRTSMTTDCAQIPCPGSFASDVVCWKCVERIKQPDCSNR